MTAIPPRPATPAPGTGLGADLGAALRFSGAAVTRRLPLLIPGAVLYGVLALVIDLAPTLLRILFGDKDWIPVQDRDGMIGILLPGMEGGSWISAFLLLVTTVASVLWTSGLYRFGTDLLDSGGDLLGPVTDAGSPVGPDPAGHPPSGPDSADGVPSGRPTAPPATRYLIGSGAVVGTIILTGLATFGGLLLCVLPGLVVAVILFFAAPASARGQTTPFTHAVQLCSGHVGGTILVVLLCTVVGTIAQQWAVVDALLQPFLTLFTLGMFERFSGRYLPEIPTPAR